MTFQHPFHNTDLVERLMASFQTVLRRALKKKKKKKLSFWRNQGPRSRGTCRTLTMWLLDQVSVPRLAGAVILAKPAFPDGVAPTHVYFQLVQQPV